MKLRKTLAGILGAVVMLLGVGTFEHINRETGVKAAIETVTLKYTIASASSVTLTSGNANGISATFKNTYTGNNKQQLTKNNSATLTLSNFSNYEGYSVTGLTLSMKSNSKDGSGSLSVNLGGETIYSFDAKPFNDKLWNGAYTQSFTDIKYTDFSEREIKSSDSLTITIAATVNSIYIESYTIEFSKESSGPVGLDVPTNLSINNYTGIATWDIVNNASGYNCIIDNDETNPIFVSGTSYQLENGQTIKVCSVGDGTNYLDSDYSEACTYKAIQVTTEVQSWIEPYYNDGVYTKKSEIYLNEKADVDLEEVIHFDDKQPLRLNRTTYYTKNALFMSNLDGSIGGEGQINSGYRNEGSDLRHFTLNSNNKPANDWKVSNTSLKEFFVTLDKFNGKGYFDNWKLSATEATFDVNQSNKNSETVKDFINFAAPCLEFVFNEKYDNYFNLERLSITQDKNDRGEKYLSMKIYVNQTNLGALVNDKGILAESRIYSGNNVFDENATARITKTVTGKGNVTSNNEKDYYILGEEVTFTLVPADGYEITSISYNSKAIEITNNLGCNITITVDQNNTINKFDVTFTEIPSEGEVIYSYTFASSQYSKNETKNLNGVNWTLAGNGGYYGSNATKGQQFGSKKAPYKSLTLTSTEFKNVTKIIINTSGGSSVNATLTVYVGGVKIGYATITADAKSYEFECDKITGEVEFSYTQTSSKAIYIKSISVTYSE